MAKRVLILNGSARLNGNTTALVKAFAEGAKSAGHQVMQMDLQKMDIHPCLGCNCGGKNAETPCVQKDEMQKIYDVYREADVIVLASPLFYWGISGQLKSAFDRLFAVREAKANFPDVPFVTEKESYLLMTAAGYAFEASIDWYETIVSHLGWKDNGKLLFGNCHTHDAKAIQGQPILDEARQTGAKL